MSPGVGFEVGMLTSGPPRTFHPALSLDPAGNLDQWLPGLAGTAVLPGTSLASLSPGPGGLLFGSSQNPPDCGDMSRLRATSVVGQLLLFSLQTDKRVTESSPIERKRGLVRRTRAGLGGVHWQSGPLRLAHLSPRVPETSSRCSSGTWTGSRKRSGRSTSRRC